MKSASTIKELSSWVVLNPLLQFGHAIPERNFLVVVWLARKQLQCDREGNGRKHLHRRRWCESTGEIPQINPCLECSHCLLWPVSLASCLVLSSIPFAAALLEPIVLLADTRPHAAEPPPLRPCGCRSASKTVSVLGVGCSDGLIPAENGGLIHSVGVLKKWRKWWVPFIANGFLYVVSDSEMVRSVLCRLCYRSCNSVSPAPVPFKGLTSS